MEIRIEPLGMDSVIHHQNSTKDIRLDTARIVTLALKKIRKKALST